MTVDWHLTYRLFENKVRFGGFSNEQNENLNIFSIMANLNKLKSLIELVGGQENYSCNGLY